MGCNYSKENLPSIPVLGLIDAGKTSIIYYILHKTFRNVHQTLDTQTSTASYKGQKVNLLDVPGRDCSYWSRYYSNSIGIIFVVDGTNKTDTDLFIEYVRLALTNNEVQKVPILFYINKCTEEEGNKIQELLKEKLQLNQKNIKFSCINCNPKTGHGIFDGFEWLMNNITENNPKTSKTPLI